jgi:hypothetical protein
MRSSYAGIVSPEGSHVKLVSPAGGPAPLPGIERVGGKSGVLNGIVC